MFCWFYSYLKVSDEQKDSVRSSYLRRHPDAFWVCFLISLLFQLPKIKAILIEYWFLVNICQIKVDFSDFSFLHIKPKAVRYVSGVATALLGSGGLWLFECPWTGTTSFIYFSIKLNLQIYGLIMWHKIDIVGLVLRPISKDLRLLVSEKVHRRNYYSHVKFE